MCVCVRTCIHVLFLQVVSSVKDQDSYVGFVGVQEKRERQASPNPPRMTSPNPPRQPSPNPSRKPSLSLPHPVSKPDMPAPKPQLKIKSRNSSLTLMGPTDFKKVKPQLGRPPKPSQAPPSLNVGSNKPLMHTKLAEEDQKIKKPVSSLKVSVYIKTLLFSYYRVPPFR